jgi:putative component of toxin-antitoxin plasmid stabilization module
MIAVRREGVSELRINYGPGYRVYYVQRRARYILLLAGTEKFSDWLHALRDSRARGKILIRIDRLAHGNPGDLAPVVQALPGEAGLFGYFGHSARLR